MARRNIEGVELYDSVWKQGFRLGQFVQTLTGTYAMDERAPPLAFLDPGGSARTVKLPPNPKKGQIQIIVNTADAAEVITVQTAAGAGLTPAITPTQSETAVLMYNGTAWIGFVAIGV